MCMYAYIQVINAIDFGLVIDADAFRADSGNR